MKEELCDEDEDVEVLELTAFKEEVWLSSWEEEELGPRLGFDNAG